VEIVTIKTSGDRGDRDRLGAFVREIQEALLRDEVDVALHCLKDLPTEPVPGLRLSAHLEREDPRDAFISRGPTLQELPKEAVIGTGSVRRTSQLAAVRPDLTFRPLLGNVDTRMRKLMSGEYDAIILAVAGLRRLGVLDAWESSEYAELVVRPLELDQMVPAPGQAVLVLETRESDAIAHEWVAALGHADTETCATAERTFLRAFGGGCSVPVAALATASDGRLTLHGLVASPDGKTVLRRIESAAASDGISLARRLTQEMGNAGAFELFTPTVKLQGGGEH